MENAGSKDANKGPAIPHVDLLTSKGDGTSPHLEHVNMLMLAAAVAGLGYLAFRFVKSRPSNTSSAASFTPIADTGTTNYDALAVASASLAQASQNIAAQSASLTANNVSATPASTPASTAPYTYAGAGLASAPVNFAGTSFASGQIPRYSGVVIGGAVPASQLVPNPNIPTNGAPVTSSPIVSSEPVTIPGVGGSGYWQSRAGGKIGLGSSELSLLMESSDDIPAGLKLN